MTNQSGMQTISSQSINDRMVIDMLSKLYTDSAYLELKRLYTTKSFPEILRVDRRELSHSAFLAWLFNIHESHGLGGLPIQQLLKILVRRDFAQGINRHVKSSTCLSSIAAMVMNEDVQINKTNITVEKPLKSEKAKGRMDIVMDCRCFVCGVEKNIHIILENKVYSDEHDHQTGRYYSQYENILDKTNDYYFFVFLTPLQSSTLNNMPEPLCGNKEFIQINYQDIMDEILEPMLQRPVLERTRFIIEEYIQSLAMPAIDENNNKIKPNTIMAISSKTSEMLTSFWTNNSELLQAIMCNIMNDDNQDAELKGTAQQFYNALAKREKDKTHYRFNGEQYNGKFALIKAVISQLLQSKQPNVVTDAFKKALEELNKIVNIKKRYDFIKSSLEANHTIMTCPSPAELYKTVPLIDLQIVYSESEYKEWWNRQKNKNGENKKKEIYSHVENFYIMNQWGYDSIDYFIYAYYKIRDNFGLSNMEIEVIK